MSGNIQPSVNNPDTDGAANLLEISDWRPSKRETRTHYCSETTVWTKYNYNGHELS